MALPLELGGIQNADIRRAFEQISISWPNTDTIHQVGGTNEPAFQNAWVNFDAANRPARFYRRGERVYLDGIVSGGTTATTAFTLPTGYRPDKGQKLFICIAAAANQFGYIAVDTNGNVSPVSGTGNVNTFAVLDGIDFRVA